MFIKYIKRSDNMYYYKFSSFLLTIYHTYNIYSNAAVSVSQ